MYADCVRNVLGNEGYNPKILVVIIGRNEIATIVEDNFLEDSELITKLHEGGFDVRQMNTKESEYFADRRDLH
ncbi:MAG: hypothetical protein AABX59_02160 [Nanoarchaeota archaeon]